MEKNKQIKVIKNPLVAIAVILLVFALVFLAGSAIIKAAIPAAKDAAALASQELTPVEDFKLEKGIEALYTADDGRLVMDETVRGFLGDIGLTLGMDKEGKLDMVVVNSQNETPEKGGVVLSNLFLSGTLGAESSEGLDAMSGATITSNALFDAIDNAKHMFNVYNGLEEPAPEEEPAPAVQAAPAGSYTPGTYTCDKETGFSTVSVEMTFTDCEITDAKVTSSGPSDLLNDSQRSSWSEQIVASQGSEVDTFTGVTMSSNAVKDAVSEILAQASAGAADAETPAEEATAEPAEETTETAEPAEESADTAEEELLPVEGIELLDNVSAVYASGDGRMVADETVKGLFGDIGLSVGVGADGKIDEITVGAHNETPGLGAAVLSEDFYSKYIGADSAEGVDAMTGATITSNALKTAVDTALKQFAALPSDNTVEAENNTAAGNPADDELFPVTGVEMLDGVSAVYSSKSGRTVVDETVKGLFGDIELTIGVNAEGKVDEIVVGANKETPGLGGAVLSEDFYSKYIGADSADGVDAMTGATITSNALKLAVSTALKQAAAK